MKKKLYTALLMAIFSVTGCNNFLDIIPDNVATLEYAFRDRIRAEQYLFTCYSYMPKHGSADDPGLTAGDALWSNPLRSGNYPNRGFDVMYRGNNVNDPLLNYWDGTNGGTALWKGIRDCNIFLENIGKVRDLNEYERNRWIAEVKFLKAYYHYYLLQLYGPIPIVKENLPISATPEEVAVYREPVDEVFKYIVELLDEAAPDLDLKVESEVTERGRITKTIVLAVKAKVLVTAASPLFNGNQDYATMVDKRGKNLFSTAEDKQKWNVALAACEEAISACMEAGVSLYTFKNTSLKISDSTKTLLTVSQVITDKWNEEVIWAWASNAQFYSSYYTEMFTIAPFSVDQRVPNGSGTFAPTMKMVEMYYTNNGVPINEDLNYDYNERYGLAAVDAKHKYYLQPNISTAKLHMNREARFYGSLGVDGGLWFGIGRFDDKQQWPVRAKLGQESGRQGIERFSPTSLYLKKLSSYLSTYTLTTYTANRWAFPVLRLSDLYLLYAEALNETLASPSPEVYRYLDMIRSRAGLNGVAESWSKHSIYPQKHLNKDGMREIIHAERNIELSFEGHRFWDIRRWKKALIYFDQPVQGWNIEGTDNASFYNVVTLKSLGYKPRDLFWPIRQSNISVNSNLMQNPGW